MALRHRALWHICAQGAHVSRTARQGCLDKGGRYVHNSTTPVSGEGVQTVGDVESGCNEATIGLQAGAQSMFICTACDGEPPCSFAFGLLLYLCYVFSQSISQVLIYIQYVLSATVWPFHL